MADNTVPYLITHGIGHFSIEDGLKLLVTHGILASEPSPPAVGDCGPLVGSNRLVGA